MAEMMVGDAAAEAPRGRAQPRASRASAVLVSRRPAGRRRPARPPCAGLARACAPARSSASPGVSGNGQEELVEVLAGQRERAPARSDATARPTAPRATRCAPQGALPARGAAAQRLRRRRCRWPRTSASATSIARRSRVGALGSCAGGALRKCARALDRRVRHQDPVGRRRHRQPVGRQRAARGAGARAGRATSRC